MWGNGAGGGGWGVCVVAWTIAAEDIQEQIQWNGEKHQKK